MTKARENKRRKARARRRLEAWSEDRRADELLQAFETVLRGVRSYTRSVRRLFDDAAVRMKEYVDAMAAALRGASLRLPSPYVGSRYKALAFGHYEVFEILVDPQASVWFRTVPERKVPEITGQITETSLRQEVYVKYVTGMQMSGPYEPGYPRIVTERVFVLEGVPLDDDLLDTIRRTLWPCSCGCCDLLAENRS